MHAADYRVGPDSLLAYYGVLLFDDTARRGNLQQFWYDVIGAECFAPEIRRTLMASFQAPFGCNRVVPTSLPPPMPISVSDALSVLLISNGNVPAGLSISLYLYSVMRAPELFNFATTDQVFPGDPRLTLYGAACGVVAIWRAKTEVNQFVDIEHSLLTRSILALQFDCFQND